MGSDSHLGIGVGSFWLWLWLYQFGVSHFNVILKASMEGGGYFHIQSINEGKKRKVGRLGSFCSAFYQAIKYMKFLGSYILRRGHIGM